MRRRIGYFLSHEQFSPASLVEAAVQAERAGFDSVWASDHFHPWQDNQGHAGNAWLTLAAAGQRTSRIELGTAVTCPIYRNHPALVAQAFATLATLSPGRVFLGVGTGEAVNEEPAGGGWGPYPERIARLGEAIGLIRRLWEEEYVDHDGEFFPIANARIFDKPSERIPIYVAATGPRSARLAGELGDGWITHSSTLLEGQAVREAFEEGQRQAAKAESPGILAEQYVFVGDLSQARAMAPVWQFSSVAAAVIDIDDPREVQRVAEESGSIEDVVSQWLVSEDPEEHVKQIERLFEAGATHVAVHSVQQDQERLIEFYRERVLPGLRTAS